jgi:HSP20 family protein
MTLIKKPELPSLLTGSWLSDFFDNDRFFDADWLRKQSVPAVNVKELEKVYEIELAAPGLTKKDFTITVDNGVLTISSEMKEENEQKEQEFTRREFSYRSFSRSFTLPENAKEDEVIASYENGILIVRIAKKEFTKEMKRKAIEVK